MSEHSEVLAASDIKKKEKLLRIIIVLHETVKDKPECA